jgi:hypothetical protein
MGMTTAREALQEIVPLQYSIRLKMPPWIMS